MVDNSGFMDYYYYHSHPIIPILSASYYLEIEDYERAAESCCEALGTHPMPGDRFSNVWSRLKKRNIFDKGLEYIDYLQNFGGQCKVFGQTMQLFLKISALYYHKQKDSKSMMEFVTRFSSAESGTEFLSSLDYLDAARLRGDVLKEAYILEKAGFVKLATGILLRYLFYRSLWGNGGKGWPLNPFPQNEDLCQKILSLAKLESNDYFDIVHTELQVLYDQHGELKETTKLLQASQRNNSLRGEILSIRKILDFHFRLSFVRYDWEDNVPVDLNKHCEEKMFREQVSVRTLVFYWNMWKGKVVRIFQDVGWLESKQPNKHVDFSLNYFGVRKLRAKGEMVYLLVDKDAEWIRKYGREGFQCDGKLQTIESKQLVFAIRSYWQYQLFSVGIKVLKTLERLHKSKSNGSAFHQSTCLLSIFEVSKFLSDCQYLNLDLQQKNRLQKFLGLSRAYFDHVFPLDWRESVSYDLVSLIETDLSMNLLDEILHQNGEFKGNQALGRVMMLLLFSPRKPDIPLQQMITMNLRTRFAWVVFFSKYIRNGLKDVHVAEALQYSLAVTWKDFQTLPFHMSPHSFLHLLDRVLFMNSCCLGMFFTARSSFVGSFSHLQSVARPRGSTPPSRQMHVEFRARFMDLVTQILCNKKKTKSWIRTSKINVASYYPVLTLRMVMMLCLICLEDPCHSEFLYESLFGGHHIGYLLPKNFAKKLKMQADQSRGFHLSAQLVSEAFMSMGDPLIIVSSEGDVNPINDAPCAIFVDLRKSKEEIMSLLFPRETAPHLQNSLHNDRVLSSNTGELRMNWNILEEISKATNVKPGEQPSLLPGAATIKEELKMNINILSIAVDHGKSVSERDSALVFVAIHQLEKLSSAVRDLSMFLRGHHFNVLQDESIKNVQELVEMLQGSKPRIDKFLSQYVISQESEAGPMVISECGNTTEVKGKHDANIFDLELQWWQL